tara:strand:- start:89 stop:1417 length:1329 start_codon:yes stop_codon:yes gene_type:complete
MFLRQTYIIPVFGLTRDWRVSSGSADGINNGLFDYSVTGDTVYVRFGDKAGVVRDYSVPDTVFVDYRYSYDGCVKTWTNYNIVDVDTAYKVSYHIQSLEDMYCEGDTDSMFVDLQPYKIDDTLAVYDPWGTFGKDSEMDIRDVNDHFYGEYTWEYNHDTTKQVNQMDTVLRFDPITGDSIHPSFFKTTFNLDVEDTLLYKPYISDTTWSTTFGPFAIEDSIFFIGEPKFCVYNNIDVQSKLQDTLALADILQEKPEFNLAIEGDDEIHIIEDVVDVPDVTLSDLENEIPSLERPLEYVIVWRSSDGDSLGATTALYELNSLVPIQQGSDTVLYVGALKLNVCTVLDTALLVIDYGIFIPTVFTPNADGSYDEWEIQNIEKFDGASVQIFNRWGSLLFETTDYPNNKFNGTYDGKALPVASYYYIVDLKNGSKLFSGAVSIIR